MPWALWGHSGCGHWAGGMVLLYPEHVAAAWLRSGVPLLKADPKRAIVGDVVASGIAVGNSVIYFTAVASGKLIMFNCG
jgi:hypothetical protein